MAQIDTILSRAVTKYGINTILKGSELKSDFPRLPSGLFPLDYSIGGGIPIGVTSSLYGPPSGGKSIVLTRLCASAQNLCWECFNYLWDCECGNKKEQKAVYHKRPSTPVGY